MSHYSLQLALRRGSATYGCAGQYQPPTPDALKIMPRPPFFVLIAAAAAAYLPHAHQLGRRADASRMN